MAPAKILLCLDTDPQPSVFDSVVAIDAGVEQLLRHDSVKPDAVRDLVYGLMFTRGGDELKSSAIFVGGSDVSKGEQIIEACRQCFFGPVRVSMMLDSGGANTTAAAAVACAGKHVDLGPEITATVLAATGPVGRRVVRLLAGNGVQVRVVSRRLERAEQVLSWSRKTNGNPPPPCRLPSISMPYLPPE